MVRRIDLFAWLPASVVSALILGLAMEILRRDGGQFVYSLDDPYIHLAMAEGIARFHYGINPGEVSAASSSVIWPLLLAPFAVLGIEAWVPLLVNAASAIAATLMLQRAVVASAISDPGPRAAVCRIILIVCLAVGLDLVGLVFTGMEHSLQVLCAMLVAYGLVREARGEGAAVWLPVAIVVGPLLRYENLALSAAAVAYLAWRGHRGLAFGALAACAVPLVGFSLFLHGLGLGWLPTSVLVKLGSDPKVPGIAGTIDSAWATAVHDFPSHPGHIVLAVMALFFVPAIIRPATVPAARPLSILGLLTIIAQLVFGEVWRFPRYEIYAEAAAAVLLLHVHGKSIGAFYRKVPVWGGAVATVSATLLLLFVNLVATIETPLAANNIFEQHFQMHRAVGTLADGPVAVNDIGWVSYRNDDYVLDLWGLASSEAWQRRRARAPGWMDDLVRTHGIELAMIYESWFGDQVPADWVLLGRLRLGHTRITPSSDFVSFYATSPAAAARLEPRLGAFVAGLPALVRFERPVEVTHRPPPAPPVS